MPLTLWGGAGGEQHQEVQRRGAGIGQPPHGDGWFSRIPNPAPPYMTPEMSPHHTCVTESVDKVILQKSIPAQICQLILHYYQYEEQFHGFVREMTFAERLHKHLV